MSSSQFHPFSLHQHPPSPPALTPNSSPPTNPSTFLKDSNTLNLPPSPNNNRALDDHGDEDEFYVDYIVRHKFFPDLMCWLYEVKWCGYGDELNTWEPACNLQHLPAWDIFLNNPSIKSRISASRKDSPEPSACPTTDPTHLPTPLDHSHKSLPSRKCVIKSLEKKKPLSRQLRLEKRNHVSSLNSPSGPSTRNSRRNRASKSQTSQHTNNMLDFEPVSNLSSARNPESSTGSVSGSGFEIVDLIRDYLQTFLGPMEDVYQAACQSIRWDDQRLPYLNGSTVVIWGRDSAYSKRAQSESGGGYEFETVALWYCLSKAGAIRAKFGDLNRSYHVIKSVVLDKVKPEAVNQLFIHRSHLHQLSRLGGLSELIRQQGHFVDIYAFGSSVCMAEKDIRPILTWGSVVIPTMNCVLADISPDGKNPFTEFIEVQRGNPTSQMFLTLATLRRLVHESQNASKDGSRVDGRVEELLGSVLDELRNSYSGKVTISPNGRRCLWEATFGVLEDTPGEQNFQQAEWDEQAEVNLILKALNDIRQLLYEDVRKFVMVVEDGSAWLSKDNKLAWTISRGIEVVSISEAIVRLSKPGSIL